MKIKSIIGVSMLAVFLLSACAEQEVTKEEPSDEVKKKMEEDDVQNNEEGSAEEETNEPEKVAVGDTLNVNGIKITVTNAEVYNGEINEYEPLKEDHAVKIDVIIENTNKESLSIFSDFFQLYGTDGFEIESALPTEDEELYADIAGGKKAKGALFYDVPAQKGNWELHYTDFNSYEGDSAIWEIPAK